MESHFNSRINYDGTLEDISRTICKTFNIGDFAANKLILTGYEDYNFILETTKGKYFVKIFANDRRLKECERYIEVMMEAIKAKVKTPKLIKSKSGYLNIVNVNNAQLRFCLAEYLSGKDLFRLNKTPDSGEIRFIAQQAALINSIKIKPSFIYDSWAITNFKKEFEKKAKYLPSDDMKIIMPLVKEFDGLKIHNLPHCFVHGDILRTNVMKDDKNELWIIDFSVSNYYPRIQELAVLACDLLFDPKNKMKSEENLGIALNEYQKRIPLTEKELNALPTYIKLAHAMHLLRANYEKVVGKNISKENEHFLNWGRMGIKQMME